jgi:xylan 1,4-beta-xylosidase
MIGSMKITAACLLSLLIFSSCNSRFLGGAKGTPIQLADPTVFYDNGIYYLYGTGSSPYHNGFVVYISKDLKRWSGPNGVNGGYALKQGDAFGDAKFWAPQVFRNKGKFYMAYTANEHIAVAESDHPRGPFRQAVVKPIEGKARQIDPFVFIDDDGKKYLYYVKVADGANRIYVAELNDDLLSGKKGAETKCIEADHHWENTGKDKWSVTEGPTVIKHKDLYYLVYSANHFKSMDYAVGYAVSNRPLGPWKKYGGNPIIHRSNTGFNGSGHGDLVKTRKNEWVYVFHTHHSAEKVSPRKTGILPVRFVKNPNGGADILQADGKSLQFLFSN